MGLRPTKVGRGARTLACRVHSRVNALNLQKKCSREREHGTQKVRPPRGRRLHGSATTNAAHFAHAPSRSRFRCIRQRTFQTLPAREQTVCHNERFTQDNIERQMSTTQPESSRPPEPERSPSLQALLSRWQWILVAALCLLAFSIRVFPRFDLVFQSGFVNFQETDAWYHVRLAENLVRHFPWRVMVDPYVVFGNMQNAGTPPPFYDWLLGLIAWVAGGGQPSESLLDGIAAWYPAVLGAFIVVAVFLLAKLVFGLRAALLAAAIIATLPGHFLRVSSLGFTDHHVMESLLVTLFFYLLLRGIRTPHSVGISVATGLTLTAYTLTFHGAAFVVGIVLVWALYDRVRSFWPREEPEPSLRPVYIAFLIAFSICLLFHRQKWMNYTLIAFGLGSLSIGAVELWAKLCSRFARPRLPFLGGLVAAGAVSLALAAVLLPDFRQTAKTIASAMMPNLFGVSGAINELQPLVYEQGHFTLMPALHQFYGAYFLALVGLFLLAESALKRADPGRALIFFWGLTTFVLAMGQLRMTYYFAIAVALLSGYVAESLLAAGRKTAWVTAFCLGIFVFAPNLYAAVNGDPSDSIGVPSDWREALTWMRASTPEPFGDPAFFYARYKREQFGPAYRYPPGAYSVMAWWDYGYWIEDVARRIPVANPGQANAKIVADFFLSQSEREATRLLEKWRTRYVVVDERLSLWPATGSMLVGDYPAFFEYSPGHRRDDYLMMAYQPDAEGKPAPKVFYLPAYYRSLVVRLFVFGGQAVDGQGGATILFLRPKTPVRPGSYQPGSYQDVVGSKRFESAEEALAAEAACRKEGCVLVGDNPMVSCVALEPLHRFRPVFSSTTSVIGFGSAGRKEVQVYEFTGASR
jgi:oligosaccharyl transferase (archaeosortase A-associated)